MESDKTPKKGWTWERTIEVSKIVATLYAACLGTFVTMQFNERQHELARIEAIAKMLPSLAAQEHDHEHSKSDSPDAPAASDGATGAGAPSKPQIVAKASDSKQRMVRDGAIWAIFRTAQNKNMLRDLANLFPQDIYRVVSSIAASGGLEHDEDEIMALQIASEKLANKYMDENDNVMAAKLYNQALRLKERLSGQNVPLFIVDLSDRIVEELPDEANADRQAVLLASLNKLGELHSIDSDETHRVNTGHFQSKQLFNRVRTLGKNSKDASTRAEVVRADQGLAHLYEREKRYKTALAYLNEAVTIEKEIKGEKSSLLGKLESEIARVKGQIAAHQDASASSSPTSTKSGNGNSH
jgi:tetratricopeptide (TPR) repeat protein